MIKCTRPSTSIFAYCKRSKTGQWKGLGMRLQHLLVSDTLELIRILQFWLLKPLRNYFFSGCWFGDPQSGNRMWIAAVDPCNVSAADKGSTLVALAHGLLEAFFTRDELKSGCLMKPQRSDIAVLDQPKIQAIRGRYIGRKKSTSKIIILTIFLQSWSIEFFIVEFYIVFFSPLSWNLVNFVFVC